MLRLSGRYLGRPLFTRFAYHSRRVCLLFIFTSKDCRLLALAFSWNILDFNTFNLYSCILLRKNADPFDLLCIVLMQAVTVQQEQHRRLLVLQVSCSGMPASFISRREGLDGVANHRPWDCMLFCPQDNRVDLPFDITFLKTMILCLLCCGRQLLCNRSLFADSLSCRYRRVECCLVVSRRVGSSIFCLAFSCRIKQPPLLSLPSRKIFYSSRSFIGHNMLWLSVRYFGRPLFNYLAQPRPSSTSFFSLETPFLLLITLLKIHCCFPFSEKHFVLIGITLILHSFVGCAAEADFLLITFGLVVPWLVKRLYNSRRIRFLAGMLYAAYGLQHQDCRSTLGLQSSVRNFNVRSRIQVGLIASDQFRKCMVWKRCKLWWSSLYGHAVL